MSQEPILRFGVIADPQYADLDPNSVLDRHFRASLGKLAEAIATFEGEDLDFVVTLGDLIDRGWEHFAAPLEIYRRSRHECLFLPGNHDFLVEPARIAEVYPLLGMPAPYYSFVRSGIRFVVIDGCEESLFATAADPLRQAAARRRLEALEATGAINAKDWNAGISETQFAWIAGQLETARAAGQAVIVMGHYPLYPQTDHVMWDAHALTELFADAPHMLAYICGHDHRGGIARTGHCWFVNAVGMVDTPQDNAFAIVDIHADRLDIRGFGRQKDASLPLAMPLQKRHSHLGVPLKTSFLSDA
jgi:3',5'-cyclic AMP phosphodiesterase CpdA